MTPMKEDAPLLRRVRDLAEEYGMLPRGGRVLCALSGGRDSMCLAHILQSLSEEYGFTLLAAHFDHRLRSTSAQEAQFVARWCEERGIPCFLGAGDVAQWAKENAMGLEEGGRALRYRFLRECAGAQGAARIATAHHADDNAETVLLHLIRGSGLRGLGGIPPRRDELVRPLLRVTRAEIDAYVARHGIPYVEDESNQDPAYSRNYLRAEVMPRLRSLNSNLAETVSAAAASLRRDEAYLTAQALSALRDASDAAGSVIVPADAIALQPDALAPRVVQAAVERLDPDLVLTARQRQAVVDLCRGADPSGQFSLPKGLSAQRVYRDVVFSFPGRVEVLPETPLDFTGAREIGPVLVRTAREMYSGGMPGKDEFFLPDRPVLLRPRREGDRLRVAGRPEKTLKKWFIEEKIPQARRALVPVLEQDGRCAAALGFGQAEGTLPRPGEGCLHITIKYREEEQK